MLAGSGDAVGEISERSTAVAGTDDGHKGSRSRAEAGLHGGSMSVTAAGSLAGGEAAKDHDLGRSGGGTEFDVAVRSRLARQLHQKLGSGSSVVAMFPDFANDVVSQVWWPVSGQAAPSSLSSLTLLRGLSPMNRGLQVVEATMASAFKGEEMNAAVSYLESQRRISRLLRDVPPSTRRLFLRKVDDIFGCLLSMDKVRPRRKMSQPPLDIHPVNPLTMA